MLPWWSFSKISSVILLGLGYAYNTIFPWEGGRLLLISIVIGLASISGLVVDSMNRFLSVTCHFINIYIRLQGFIIIMYSRSQCVAMHFLQLELMLRSSGICLNSTTLWHQKIIMQLGKKTSHLNPQSFDIWSLRVKKRPLFWG